MKEVDVKFGIVVLAWPFDESRGSEFVSQIMAYLSGLEDHFDSAWIADHFVPYHMVPSRPHTRDNLECLTTISYLSGIFKKLSFGSIVLCNSFRNPALVAKMGATLDVLTGGRFILGLGAGWMEEEHIEYGYDFPSPAVRIKRLEEGVQIIKRMWTEDAVTFEGKHYTVKNAHCNPKPDPPPPIMIGGAGEKLTLKVVARYADWWNMHLPDLAEYKHKLNVLDHHCSRIGRDSDEIVKTAWRGVVIADTDEKAVKIAKETPFGNRAIAGSPETIKEKIGEFVDTGVEYFMLSFMPFPRLEGPLLFAEEVISGFT